MKALFALLALVLLLALTACGDDFDAEAEKEVVVAVSVGMDEDMAIADREAALAAFHEDLTGFASAPDVYGSWAYQDLGPDWLSEPDTGRWGIHPCLTRIEGAARCFRASDGHRLRTLQIPGIGLERYHPAQPALLSDDARQGPTTCFYGEFFNSRLLSDEQALCNLTEEALEGDRAQARQARARPVAGYSYPTSLDWRWKDGQDWTTPVREASTCGSCVAFGVIGSIESRLKIAAGDSSLSPDLSEAHLFFGSCDQCCDGGMTVDPALDYARDTGIADEECYPYSPQNQPCSPCAGWQSRTTALAGWALVTEPEDMKQALAGGGPIVATLTLYEDFRDYTGGIYQREGGKIVGTHAVTLVGYDDTEGYWIGKNSWGTDWGEDKDGNVNGGGWFRINYGQVGIDAFAYVPLVSVEGAGYIRWIWPLTEKRLRGSLWPPRPRNGLDRGMAVSPMNLTNTRFRRRPSNSP